MSKIIQDRKMEEEPAVTKPRSVCLISTSLNREQSSSFGPDVSNVSENPQLDSGSVKGAPKKMRADSVRKGPRETACGPKQSPKPRNVFSSVERRQPVSKGCGKLQWSTA